MQHKLEFLLQEKLSLEQAIGLEKKKSPIKPSVIASFEIRLKQVKHRLNTFGQKYNIVEGVIEHTNNGQTEKHKVYLTNISLTDAETYLRVIFNGVNPDFKPKITCQEIPTARLLKF